MVAVEEQRGVIEKSSTAICYHCGQDCNEGVVEKNGKRFCCYGCETVYTILNENNLCEYYSYSDHPGIKQNEIDHDRYAYLDEKDIRDKIVSFQSPTFSKVTLHIPTIHCISCIWLLENLQRFQKGILRSEVNFARKTITIEYNPCNISLRSVVSALARVGYPPVISLEGEKNKKQTNPLLFKLAIAGFCFGNIMLFSFPEYLGLDTTNKELQRFFSYLNILLALPIIFYSGADYFHNAINSFKQKQINIDAPIAVGLAALFLRSVFDIVTHASPGYLDSLSGLVFFLLIGRWFQDKTYESLAFERDYKSYFPLVVYKKQNDEWKPVVIYTLEKNDLLKIRNLEIVPTDSVLLSKQAYIDYSFVTGEARPVKLQAGEWVYAGGRLLGEPVVLEVQKKTSQSHLTSLWNNPVFQKLNESKYKKKIDVAARGFTWAVLALSCMAAVYWYITDPSQVWLILTSVLIVACPCTLALAAPFTYGSVLRVLGNHGLYLKNADVIERMAAINSVVFDKTGTITYGSEQLYFVGNATEKELAYIKSITASSTHPLSNQISASIINKKQYEVSWLHEHTGKGIEGIVDRKNIKVGSAAFVGTIPEKDQTASYVYVLIDDRLLGYFKINTTIRKGVKELIGRFKNLHTALLSGDNESDKKRMADIFSDTASLHFHQSPHDKMNFIKSLQQEGNRVMMLGDGLNDAGALKQSDVGIGVTDNNGVFTPGCDGILKGESLSLLDQFIQLTKQTKSILNLGFAISFMYNIISISFAVSGHLTPLVAAVIMPLSSLSVVGFTTMAVKISAKRIIKTKAQ